MSKLGDLTDVASCVESALAGRSAEKSLVWLERCVATVCVAAADTLGERNVRAILRRVVAAVGAQLPAFQGVDVDLCGLNTEMLRDPGSDLSREAVMGYAQALVTELLRVIGQLTGEVLTPRLLATVRRVVLTPPPPPEELPSRPQR